ncbi:leucine-rich_repeat domain-containing protein [Hexamita inflata]|uniref:Leucine-rich repeat domain-containing protein n=1 Tax=Hexamita inflata TaxID=28002 RepID=A0AA86NYX8_9EUKA|nr:leucine-rich repeat domain-containing protein [Hexamita inflata]
MIEQFKEQIKDGALKIKNNQQLTDLTFIKILNVSKLTVEYCQNIIQNINNNTIKELHIQNCNFENVLGIQLNNLKVLSIKEQKIKNMLDILITMQNSPQFSQLQELNISEQIIAKKIFQKEISENQKLKIEQLNDQKYMVNLVKLKLLGNDISDINILSTFINLEELDLSGNKKIHIGPIKYLTKLIKLSLDCCELTDIQDLSHLTNLIDLSLCGNQDVDIAPLNNLTQLVSLQLHGCGLTDIFPLQYLTQLNYLLLSVNSIKDVSFLRSLRNLKELSLAFNDFVDIVPLQHLENLSILDLSYIKIKDFSVLRKLRNLEELSISGNFYLEISVFQYLVKLRKLNLSRCKIYDISSLRPLVNLQKLILDDNLIYDISPLALLKKLTELSFKENKITSILKIQQHPFFHNFKMDFQENPTQKEHNIYIKIQKIDDSTIILQNMSQKRKQIFSRINSMKGCVFQCLQNQSLNHFQLSQNIVSLFNTLNITERYQ